MQTEGTRNFLALDLSDDCEIIPYCERMLENNVGKIPGVLPLQHQLIDGKERFLFSVSGKVRLEDYVRQHPITTQNGDMLLQNLIDAMLGLEEYFLSIGQCVLDPNDVYIGDGLRTYLICLPIKTDNADLSRDLKNFFEQLLSNYFASEGNARYNAMFMWIFKEQYFDLASFRKRFFAETKEAAKQERAIPSAPKAAPVQKVKAAPQAAPQSNPAPASQQKASPVQQAASFGGVKIPGAGGVKIPQSSPVPGKKQDKKKDKDKKAQKSEKHFSLFGHKNKEEKEPKDEQPVKKPASNAAIPKGQKAGGSTPKPAPVRVPNKTAPGAKDREGTILVDDAGTFGSETVIDDGGSSAYLVYRGSKVMITTSPFTIGKYNENLAQNLAIYDNRKVSRKHASILKKNNGYYLRDDKSLNGTFLNGRKLAAEEEKELHDGDRIGIYDEEMTFHLK